MINAAPVQKEPVASLAQRIHSGYFSRLSTFPAAIVVILIGKAFWTCRENIVDTDIWWHLRNAREMVALRQFPAIDSYSFTASGSPWLDHSWLSEVVYYFAYHALGLRGVFIVFATAVTFISVAIFALCMKRTVDPLAAGVATIFGGLLAMVGFTPRAQNFGWLCFAAVFAILLEFRTLRRAPLWLMPPLFCVWINCHPGWPMGLVVFGIILASGLIRKDVGQLTSAPWTRSEVRKLSIAFVASLAALFVNPFGLRLVLYPFDVAFHQKLNITLGGEWAPVNFGDSRGIFVLITLGAVFAIALLPRKPWRIDDAILVAFVLYCGLTHIRFLVLTGIVLPPLLSPQLGNLSSYDPARERRLLNAALIIGVLLSVVLGFPAERVLDDQVKKFFPDGAVGYLRTNPEQGNMFNQYEWGGFLEWNLPQTKTFIDSRTDIFEYRGVLRDYFKISTFNDTQDLLDTYHISYVLYPTGTPLAYFLSKSLHWDCIYQDNQAVIYRRREQ